LTATLLHRGRICCGSPTSPRFLYVAVVARCLQPSDRGWSMATSLGTRLVLDALNMALAMRRPKGVIHHSDQGSQYTSIEFGHRCRAARGRRCLRQCDVRELLRHTGMRASRQAPVQDASRGAARGVLVHRGLLQPALSSFVDRLSIPDRIRASSRDQSRRTPDCRRARGRQGQALRAAPKWGRP
jgi:hypothetical protein